MPIADNEAVEITVLSGHGDPPSITLIAGMPKNPFAVGSAGEWRIAGAGVAPVHFYFAFDGHELFVVPASPQHPVLLAGVAIGMQWSRVTLPCELRFAGACLVLRTVAKFGTTMGAVSTVRDGDALRKAAERAVAAAHRVSVGGVSDAPGAFAPGDAARGPGAPELYSTMILPNRPPPPAHALGPAGVAGARAPAPRSPGPTPPAAAPAPHPPPVDPRATPAGPSAAPVATPPDAPNDATKQGYWQSASPVKKASLVMAPFALALAYWMLQDPPPAPPPKVLSNTHKPSDAQAAIEGGAPQSSAATQVTAEAGAARALPVERVDAADAGHPSHAVDAVPVAPAASNAPTPKKTLGALAAGKRTADRQALDAVANGSFDDAIKQYGDLANAHADVPAYQEAARILQEKAARGR
jgi:hypothetical protein